MNFANKLKRMRKKAGFSQEKLADKLAVSRQAVTKWETENGIPDIENIISIAKLFNVSLDELLLDGEAKKRDLEYLFESMTEYDIDGVKHFDMKLGDAKSVFVNGYDGEKLYVKLASNTLAEIAQHFKVKIDDIKKRIDLEINNDGAITRAQIKDALIIFIKLPNRYIKCLEIALNSKNIELNCLKSENIELDIKTSSVWLKNTAGSIEINCNEDMQIMCDTLQGQLAINQCSATSTLFIPEELPFRVVKKGIGTKIYFQKDEGETSDFSVSDSDNVIEFNGIKSELIISALSSLLPFIV